ncbi:glycosyltransferase [Corynebacterium nasicanis]|uniref:Glycosyltransferase n=1 Tax=Corynebacterium nasicanis TaxID=1448267 RepID=A0ABW1Q8G4_9CORY
MKISVMCIASRSGGGLTVLQSLVDYAVSADTGNEWQFIVSDQELPAATERVSIVRACPDYRGWRSRLRGELTVGRRAVQSFHPDVVVSLHNIDTLARGRFPLAVYVQQALPFQRDYRLSWRDPRERGLAWRQYLLRFPILHAVRKAAVTFVQTSWLAAELSSAVPGARVRSIGFEQADRGDLPYGPTVRENRFFFPAAASSYKNHRVLHEAVQMLQDRGVAGPVALTLQEQDLRTLIGESAAADFARFDFRGWLSHEEVLALHGDSILVFPSLVESLGLPLYEAREAGVWIVAADLAYAREALEEYPLVAWFDPQDAASLAAAMEKAWNSSRQERERLSGGAVHGGGWERMVEELRRAL